MVYFLTARVLLIFKAFLRETSYFLHEHEIFYKGKIKEKSKKEKNAKVKYFVSFITHLLISYAFVNLSS